MTLISSHSLVVFLVSMNTMRTLVSQLREYLPQYYSCCHCSDGDAAQFTSFFSIGGGTMPCSWFFFRLSLTSLNSLCFHCMIALDATLPHNIDRELVIRRYVAMPVTALPVFLRLSLLSFSYDVFLCRVCWLSCFGLPVT